MTMTRLCMVLIFLFQLFVVSCGDTSCDGCNDKLTREIEKSTKELSRCRANHLALETRESILKEQVVACEEQRKSLQHTSADLQSKLYSAMNQQTKDRDNFQTERDALFEMVNTLKQTQKELQEKYDTTVQDHRIATEKQQLRHAQQLELVLSHDTQLEKQLEEATDKQTSLEESYRSLQLEIDRVNREKEDALKNADKLRSQFSKDHLSCEKSLSTFQVQLEQAEKERVAQLADFQSYCESQKQAVDERYNTRVEELQATIDQLQIAYQNEKMTLQEQLSATLLEQQAFCENKVTELHKLHHQLDASMKSKLLETEESCAKHKEDLHREMAVGLDRAKNQGIEIGKNKTSSSLLRLKQRHGKLTTNHLELIEQTKSDSYRLRQVKDELFELRRELFVANEKLREPEIRHRVRIKRIRAVFDLVVKFLAPLYQEYLQPYWIPTKRYVFDALDYFQREHLPGIQARAIYALKSSRDLTNRSYDGVRQGYNALKNFDSKMIIDASANERKLFSDACVRVRTFLYDESYLPFHEQSLKPLVDKHWLPLYRMHIVPLWRSFVDTVSPHLADLRHRCQAAVRHHGVVRDVFAKKLYFFADVLSDYCHMQEYGLLARILVFVRDSSSDLVHLAEYLILGSLAVAVFTIMGQRRRKTKKQAD